MPKIVTEEYLVGVKFWMQIFKYRKPMFEVYRYIGHNEIGDIFFFQALRTHETIFKRMDEVGKSDFRPFLLDSKRIAKAKKELDG